MPRASASRIAARNRPPGSEPPCRERSWTVRAPTITPIATRTLTATAAISAGGRSCSPSGARAVSVVKLPAPSDDCRAGLESPLVTRVLERPRDVRRNAQHVGVIAIGGALVDEVCVGPPASIRLLLSG